MLKSYFSWNFESTYEEVSRHARVDGSKGSSVTVQYRQTHVGEQDLPWTNKNGNNVKKDQFFLSISNIPDSWDASKEEACFNLMTGVLPNGFDVTENWAECASTKKDAGY